MTLRLTYGIVRSLTCKDSVIRSFLNSSRLSKNIQYFSNMEGELATKGVLIHEIKFNSSVKCPTTSDEFICLMDIRKTQNEILKENNLI